MISNKIFRAVFIFIGAMVLFIEISQAMQCIPTPLSKNIKEADAIFMGTVENRVVIPGLGNKKGWEYSEDMPLCGQKVASLTVSKVWKGNIEQKTSVYSWDACYGLGTYFELGEKYLVFAKLRSKNGSDYVDMGCPTIFHPSEKSERVMKKLDALFIKKGK